MPRARSPHGSLEGLKPASGPGTVYPVELHPALGLPPRTGTPLMPPAQVLSLLPLRLMLPTYLGLGWAYLPTRSPARQRSPAKSLVSCSRGFGERRVSGEPFCPPKIKDRGPALPLPTLPPTPPILVRISAQLGSSPPYPSLGPGSMKVGV